MPGLMSMMTGQMSPYDNMYKQPAQTGNPFMVPQMPSQETIAELQKTYGVQFPQHLRQNLFMPEPGSPGFFGRHPGLSRAIEGGMIGAMETPPSTGFEGAGQGVSRALQGMFGVPQMHRAFQSAQIQAPFQQAEQIGGLREAAEQLQTMKALQEFYSGRNQNALAVQQARGESADEIQRLKNEEQQLKGVGTAPWWLTATPEQRDLMKQMWQAQYQPKAESAGNVATIGAEGRQNVEDTRAQEQGFLMGERLGQQQKEFDAREKQQKAEFDQNAQRQAETAYRNALRQYQMMKIQSNFGIPLDPAADAEFEKRFPPPSPADFGLQAAPTANATPVPGMTATTPKGAPGPGQGQGAAAPQTPQSGPANQDPLRILGH